MTEMEKLVTGMTEAVRGCRFTTSRPAKLHKFQGRPTRPDDPTLKEWLEDVFYCAQAHIPESQQPSVILAHLEGSARVEVRCHSDIEKLSNLYNRLFTIGCNKIMNLWSSSHENLFN